jgi:hypothetical protein
MMRCWLKGKDWPKRSIGRINEGEFSGGYWISLGL